MPFETIKDDICVISNSAIAIIFGSIMYQLKIYNIPQGQIILTIFGEEIATLSFFLLKIFFMKYVMPFHKKKLRKGLRIDSYAKA